MYFGTYKYIVGAFIIALGLSLRSYTSALHLLFARTQSESKESKRQCHVAMPSASRSTTSTSATKKHARRKINVVTMAVAEAEVVNGGDGDSVLVFYEDEDNLKKLCNFLRSSEGPPVREAIEMEKRVYYLKGITMVTTEYRHVSAYNTLYSLVTATLFSIIQVKSLLTFSWSQKREPSGQVTCRALRIERKRLQFARTSASMVSSTDLKREAREY